MLKGVARERSAGRLLLRGQRPAQRSRARRRFIATGGDGESVRVLRAARVRVGAVLAVAAACGLPEPVRAQREELRQVGQFGGTVRPNTG